MAKPIERIYKSSKKKLIGQFPHAIKRAGMQWEGCHERLGIISFRGNTGPVLYAHIVEKESGSSHVSIAPGLSYLKERDQSEVPESIIKNIMNQLYEAIKN